MTRLRCGGIINDRCIANFLEIVTVKEFKNRPIFDEVMCRAFGVHFFGPPCIVVPSLILPFCVMWDTEFQPVTITITWLVNKPFLCRKNTPQCYHASSSIPFLCTFYSVNSPPLFDEAASQKKTATSFLISMHLMSNRSMEGNWLTTHWSIYALSHTYNELSANRETKNEIHPRATCARKISQT